MNESLFTAKKRTFFSKTTLIYLLFWLVLWLALLFLLTVKQNNKIIKSQQEIITPLVQLENLRAWRKWIVENINQLQSKINELEEAKTLLLEQEKIESWWNWSVEKVNSWWNKLVLVNGFAEDSLATMVSTYAYELDNARRKDFVIMMKCENGNFDIHLQSSVPDTNWPNWREDSRGLCQLNRTRHSEVVDNPLFRNDWKRQVEQCYKNGLLEQNSIDRIDQYIKNWKYVWICKDVVKNDFTLISK